MSPLVDTNVLSELFRPRPDPGVVRWAESLTDIRLSVITIDELWYGLTRKPGERLVTSVETFLDTRCEVLPVTSEIAKQSGVLRADSIEQLFDFSVAFSLFPECTQVHWFRILAMSKR